VPPKYSDKTSVSGSQALSVTVVPGIEGQTNGGIAWHDKYLGCPDLRESYISESV
jgi:hypothetical protein